MIHTAGQLQRSCADVWASSSCTRQCLELQADLSLAGIVRHRIQNGFWPPLGVSRTEEWYLSETSPQELEGNKAPKIAADRLLDVPK